MGLVNHMMHLEIFGIQMPDEFSAKVTNSVASITAQSAVCRGLYGRRPNVVLVSVSCSHASLTVCARFADEIWPQLDYIDKGDAIGAQAALNGL